MRRTLLLFALWAAPATAGAQSSQLSVSGLGIPGRGLSVRSWATGGSSAIFDGESSLNPAALSNTTLHDGGVDRGRGHSPDRKLCR